jgi:uncharacterized membrane protein YfbV (UPF0208 family)
MWHAESAYQVFGAFQVFGGQVPGVQAAFWAIAMIYAAAAGLWWLTKRVRTRLRRAA